MEDFTNLQRSTVTAREEHEHFAAGRSERVVFDHVRQHIQRLLFLQQERVGEFEVAGRRLQAAGREGHRARARVEGRVRVTTEAVEARQAELDVLSRLLHIRLDLLRQRPQTTLDGLRQGVAVVHHKQHVHLVEVGALVDLVGVALLQSAAGDAALHCKRARVELTQ